MTPTPPDIVRAAYAELVVTDLAEARRFWVDLLGFLVSHDTRDALYLRGYDELTHHNLILRQGREPAAARLAFRVRTAADLDLAEAFFAALGSRTARVPAGVTPGVEEAVRTEDPLGFTVEFFFDAAYAERLQQRYDLRRGAEPARLDHFNIVVPDVRAAYEYYTSLGFSLSETIEDERNLYAAWMFRKQTVRDPRRRDFWGHAVIPSWYTEATAVLDLDGHPRPLLRVTQAAEVTVGADGFTR